MTDNVFQHDESFSGEAVQENFAPTAAPPVVSKAAPALSVMYVIPYLLFLVFSFSMIFTARIFRCYDKHCKCQRRRQGEENDERSNVDGDEFQQRTENFRTIQSAHERDSFSIGESTVVALGMRDRIRLYRRTFDKNQHFKVLTPKEFCRPGTDDTSSQADIESNSNNDQNEDETIHCSLNDDDDDDDEIKSTCAINESDDDINSIGGIDDEDPSWIYLPLASPESNPDNSSTPKKEGDSPKKDPDAIYSCHTCETIETATTATTSASAESSAICSSVANPPLTRVPGNCIICFEKFEVGEKVVWSDDTSKCRHVFHEDCMIKFLATHSKRTKRPLSSMQQQQQQSSMHSSISYSYAENPCPICRRPFCTVRHDDLVMAVLLKSVAVALGEEEEDLPASSRGGGEGSPFTSSERSQRIVATSYALASATMGMDSALPGQDAIYDELEYTHMSLPD